MSWLTETSGERLGSDLASVRCMSDMTATRTALCNSEIYSPTGLFVPLSASDRIRRSYPRCKFSLGADSERAKLFLNRSRFRGTSCRPARTVSWTGRACTADATSAVDPALDGDGVGGDLHRRRRSGRQMENATVQAPRRNHRRDLNVIDRVELIVARVRLVDRKLHY